MCVTRRAHPRTHAAPEHNGQDGISAIRAFADLERLTDAELEDLSLVWDEAA